MRWQWNFRISLPSSLTTEMVTSEVSSSPNNDPTFSRTFSFPSANNFIAVVASFTGVASATGTSQSVFIYARTFSSNVTELSTPTKLFKSSRASYNRVHHCLISVIGLCLEPEPELDFKLFNDKSTHNNRLKSYLVCQIWNECMYAI